MITSRKLANEFAKRYTLPVRTFGLTKRAIGTEKWRLRRLTANILVGGSNEDNAIAATIEIFEQFPKITDIGAATVREIADILDKHRVRFSGRKAEYLIDTAIAIVVEHGGKVPHDRESLEAFPGVGRHTASIVRALAFEEQEFGVDLHVRRIAKRLGLVGEKDNDLTIENKLVKGVNPENYALYSRAFVEFGKETCGHTPDCNDCFLRSQCPTGSGVEVKKVPNTAKKVEDGKYSVVAGSSDREYIVTVKGAKISCNCKGYRFRRTCSHVKEVA